MIPRRALAGLAAAFLLAGCGNGLDRGRTPDEIGFAIPSAGSSQADWRPILADMEKATGLEVKPYYRSDEAELVEVMGSGRIDVGWFSGRSGLEAARAANGEVFARVTPAPEDPVLYRKDLDPAVKEKLRQFFLTYGQGDTPEAERQRGNLAALSIDGFKPADDSHLLPLREMEAAEAAKAAREAGGAEAIEQAERTLADIRRRRIDQAGKAGEPLPPPRPVP